MVSSHFLHLPRLVRGENTKVPTPKLLHSPSVVPAQGHQPYCIICQMIDEAGGWARVNECQWERDKERREERYGEMADKVAKAEGEGRKGG